jgi:hypothetical protein
MDARLAWSEEGKSLAGGRDTGDATHDELWLLGQPPLRKYLHFIDKFVLGGSTLDRCALVEEWRRANDYYADLEAREAGSADAAQITPLPPAMQKLANDIMGEPRWKKSFATLPTEFAMVELDRLVVSQLFVNLTHTDRLQAALTSSPTPTDLFEFCFPIDRPQVPVHMRRMGSNRFMFWSDSSDFRFREPVLLSPEQIISNEGFGALTGAVALKVGYGSNLLNAFRAGDRIVLNNGYHRAYALRSLGVTHAFCVIQTVTRGDELSLAGCSRVINDPGFYLKAPRPPLLKDFFDPNITKMLQIPKISHVVELTFEVKETDIVDFAAADT